MRLDSRVAGRPVRRGGAIGAFVGVVSVVVFVLLGLSRSGSGGPGAVSFGLSEAVILGIPAVVVVAVVSYFLLRRLGWSPASLATYGPTILGGGIALITALWVSYGMSIAARG